MSRTASPAVPGTNPRDTDEPSLRDDVASALRPQAASADESLEDKVARQDREMAELRSLVAQLGKNQTASMAEAVELPTMKAVQKQNPSIPVLTDEGWFVPAVHPTDRAAKL